MNSPFTLGFGTTDINNCIERTSLERSIFYDVIKKEPINKTYLINGGRAIGKTVFMYKFIEKFRTKKNLIIAQIVFKEEMLKQLLSELYKEIKNRNLVTNDLVLLNKNKLDYFLKSNDINPITNFIKVLLTYLKDKDVKVLIFIDEVSDTKEVRFFNETYSLLLKEKFLLGLIRNGIYENIKSFVNPLFKSSLNASIVYLDPLPIKSIARSYKENLNINFDLALKFASFTKGHAYSY